MDSPALQYRCTKKVFTEVDFTAEAAPPRYEQNSYHVHFQMHCGKVKISQDSMVKLSLIKAPWSLPCPGYTAPADTKELHPCHPA